ncbi:MAG: DUF2271 domain-containing protein [Crocinitomicaceae bacterium]|nr:DUF2271 domain-containing protein [Crocinitomicaceae bacterium]
MKRIFNYSILIIGLCILSSFAGSTNKKYKCLIQMANYEGEGAYVVVSLINPKGQYEKTLYVQGDDKEWYYEITAWWKFYGKKRTKLDGITGSTLSGGERSMKVIGIDQSKIDNGYKLRFESAVEAKNYYKQDIEFSLTTANLQKKFNGKGFIRYVRMLPQ